MAKNTKFYTLASIDTVPASTAGTGVITSSGTFITGVGTLFSSEVRQNDFIFDAVTNKEVRRVLSVGSDTFLSIDQAFSAPIAGGAFRIVRSSLVFIGIACPTGVTAKIDNASVPAGTAVNWSATDKRTTANPYLDPVVVEPTGSALITTLS